MIARYALMLVCMACGALLANGATGPLAALTTLILPPEFKSFALSVYEFLTGLLAPMYSVIIGVGLQVSYRGVCCLPCPEFCWSREQGTWSFLYAASAFILASHATRMSQESYERIEARD